MVATLEKTWRKDVLVRPFGLTTEDDSNSWAIWAMKELMVTGNNGIKNGPNAWTVVGSCNAAAFGMDAVDRWVTWDDCNSSAGNFSWVVLRQPNMGAGSGLEVCFAFHDDTSYDDELTIAFSLEDGFTGGALNARPVATDEFEIANRSNSWIGGRTAATRYAITRMMSTDGHAWRLFGNAVGGARGLFLCERLKNPASWLDNDVVVITGQTELTATNIVDSGGFRAKFNDAESYVRAAVPGIENDSGTNLNLLGQTYGKSPDYNGQWPMFKCIAACMEAPNMGICGEFFDMYAVPTNLPLGYLLPGNGGENEFFVAGDYAWGNDGTPLTI